MPVAPKVNMEGALVWGANSMGAVLADPLTGAVSDSPSIALSSQEGKAFPASLFAEDSVAEGPVEAAAGRMNMSSVCI